MPWRAMLKYPPFTELVIFNLLYMGLIGSLVFSRWSFCGMPRILRCPRCCIFRPFPLSGR